MSRSGEASQVYSGWARYSTEEPATPFLEQGVLLQQTCFHSPGPNTSYSLPQGPVTPTEGACLLAPKQIPLVQHGEHPNSCPHKSHLSVQGVNVVPPAPISPA